MPASTAGINDILNAAFHAGTQRTTWYVLLIDNASYTGLAAADTISSHSGWTESTAYTQSTRPEWTEGAASGGQITNSSTVNFTTNAEVTVRGVALCSDNTKGGSSGILLTSERWLYPSPITFAAGETIPVTISIQGAL